MVADPEVRKLMQLCQMRLSLNPRDSDALFAKAAVLGKLGLYSHALECLRQVSSREMRYPGLERFRDRIIKEMDQSTAPQISLGDGIGWDQALEI